MFDKKKKNDQAVPNKAHEAKSEKKKKSEVIKTCLDLIPVRSYDEHLEAFRLVDESLMDILQIIPRDMDNESEDEKDLDIYSLIRVFKTVGCDMKFISMKFPLNLTAQKQILQHHREKSKDSVRRKWLDLQLTELEVAESTVSTLSFYLFFYGKNDDEFMQNKENILKYAGSGISPLTNELSKYQKVQILQKLANMNTTIELNYDEERSIRYGTEKE